MNEIPEQSIAFAQKYIAVRERDKEFHPIINTLGALRDWMHEREYGVGEAVQQGRTLRYPHEIQQQLNCAEAGIATYVIAKIAGYSPRIFRAVNYNNSETDHFIVDVPLEGKNLLIDTFFWQFGSVYYFPNHLEVHKTEHIGGMAACITLGDEEEEPIKKIPFASLEQLTDEQLHAEIRHFNSAQGFFDYFRSGQKLMAIDLPEGQVEVSVTFSPEEGSFSLQQMYVDRFLFRYVDELIWSYDTSGKISEGKRRLILAQDYGWCSYKDAVFVLEQEVSFYRGQKSLSFAPTSPWSVSFKKIISERKEEKKLRAFLTYADILGDSQFLCTPQERRNKWDKMFKYKIRCLQERNKYISVLEGDKRTVYLALISEKRENAVRIETLQKQQEYWGKFSQLDREGFSHLLDLEQFIEDYTCIQGKNNEPPDIPAVLFNTLAQRYALNIANFYAPVVQQVFSHPAVKAFFSEAEKKVELLLSIPKALNIRTYH